jgi:peptidoglycan pentaglycine glycine transferase (the first glycine)
MAFDATSWDTALQNLPEAHLLQTWEWGQIKSRYGWRVIPKQWFDAQGRLEAAALVLERPLLVGRFDTGLRILYTPRGPVMDWRNRDLRQRVLADLIHLARQEKAILVKIDPEVRLGEGIPGSSQDRPDPEGLQFQEEISQSGWVLSNEQVQFRNSAWLDLRGSEDDWLTRMKQKTRYNVRLAQKKGIQVRDGCAADYAFLYHLYAETSLRDGFVIRSENYYHDVWQTFQSSNLLDILIAEDNGHPIAAVFLFHFGEKAWYLYGMSNNESREKMPNYLLQWEAMRRAEERGCTVYDLWGAPEVFDESDSMWGVFRFKEGLGSQVVRTLGAWDYPCRPWLFKIYTRTLPRVLDVMRRSGKKRINKEVLQ